jgi:hypothetical protein
MDFAEKIAEAFRSGPFVQFRCNPAAVVSTKENEINLEATVFLRSGESWSLIRPHVSSDYFKVSLTEQRRGVSSRQFAGKAFVAGLKPGSYDLVLHLHSGNDPVAVTRLRVFDVSDLSRPLPTD